MKRNIGQKDQQYIKKTECLAYARIERAQNLELQTNQNDRPKTMLIIVAATAVVIVVIVIVIIVIIVIIVME